MTKPFILVLAAACGMGAMPAWGLTPTVKPMVGAATSYAGSGTLASISLARQTMGISGAEYRFTDALRILSANGKSLTPRDLQAGQSVAYTVDATLSPTHPYIKEIRVLGGPGKER